MKKQIDIDAMVAEAVPMRPNPQLAFIVWVRVQSETNSRGSWKGGWARSKEQKKALDDAWPREFNSPFKRKVELPCSVRRTPHGPKALDSEDNLREAFKTIKDAIARELCGGNNRWGVDDGDERITWEYAQVPVGKRVYQVRVEVY